MSLHTLNDRPGDKVLAGRVLGYNAQHQQGHILGEDGQRYAFSLQDWNNPENVEAQIRVNFVARGDIATEIYRDRPVSDSTYSSNMPLAVIAAGLAVLGLFPGFGVLPAIGAFFVGRFIRKNGNRDQSHMVLNLARFAQVLGGVVLAIYAVVLVGGAFFLLVAAVLGG
ncbi:MAG: hypothetical protein ACFB6R_10595 [Alphaproteobacteria bacterium]